MATADNTALILTVALSYGGRQDIVAAAQQLAASVQAGELQPEEVCIPFCLAVLRCSPCFAYVLL